jgi:hypothetical protein
MGSMHFEVSIGRPADEVWAYLADWRHEFEWQPGWLEVTVVPPGPVRVGTRKTKVRRTPLGVQSLTVEATRFDEAAREWDDLVVDGLAKGSIGRYRIVAGGTGTRLVVDVETRARGIGRLLGPLIDRSSGSVLRAGLERLKGILELAVSAA